MFTGIVSDVGRVRSVDRRGDVRLVLSTAYDAAAIELGASIACSGVCLTVVDKGGDGDTNWFAVDVSAETLSCTNLGDWAEGTLVNLERSLRVGDELGGHIVAGHVDGVAEILDLSAEGDSIRFRFAAPQDLARFIAPKGAVALDGVSLTVNQVEGHIFGVNIIPHTRENTAFCEAVAGGRVNLEIDILARYVARLGEAD